MGSRGKHKKDWKITTLQAAVMAKELYVFSSKIMGNPKVFDPKNDFNNRTLGLLHDKLLRIYLDTWKANRIDVTRHPEQKDKRLTMQAEVLQECEDCFALFELVKHQFHLAAGKYWHWAGMLYDTTVQISAWHNSDCIRYKDI